MTQQTSLEEFTREMERFRARGHSAFVMGYSGFAGTALVKELDKLKIFKKVVLIGRRQITLDVGPEFEQRVVDFGRINEYKDAFENLQYGFCCMGATSSRMRREDYIRITLDYCASSAKVAKEQGCKQFSLITGSAVRKHSRDLIARVKISTLTAIDQHLDHTGVEDSEFYAGAEGLTFTNNNYARVKNMIDQNSVMNNVASWKEEEQTIPYTLSAQLEERCEGLNFERLSIFRPGLILGKRRDHKRSYAFVKTVLKIYFCCCPKLVTIPDSVFVKGMIANVIRVPNPPIKEIYYNSAIYELAKYLKD